MTTLIITQKSRDKHHLTRMLAPVLLLLCTLPLSAQQTNYDQKFKEYGLVDVQTLAPSVIVELMYSSSDNFMKKDVYGDLEKAYLTPTFAEKIRQAQALLHKEKGKRYSLIIYDGARPHSIQTVMWNTVKGTPNVKYVSSPGRKNGRHTYGVAVDVSIYDTEEDKALDMGSPVDHFGIKAHTTDEKSLVAKKLITPEAYANRQYLYGLMQRVGLKPIPNEWWHFQGYESITKVKEREKHLNF